MYLNLNSIFLFWSIFSFPTFFHILWFKIRVRNQSNIWCYRENKYIINHGFASISYFFNMHMIYWDLLEFIFYSFIEMLYLFSEVIPTFGINASSGASASTWVCASTWAYASSGACASTGAHASSRAGVSSGACISSGNKRYFWSQYSF